MDPVSQKEIDRNNAVYQLQHNRNPFIDYPELAEMIFGNNTDIAFHTAIPAYFDKNVWHLYPNPATSNIQIQSSYNQQDIKTIEIADIAGKVILHKTINDDHALLDVSSLSRGIYLLTIISEQDIHTYKIVKQ